MNLKLFYLLAFLFFCYTVSSQKVSFTEVSEEAGIQHAFKVDLATFGGGVCVIDYNDDGFEDLYVTGGANPDVLYKNNGNGTFSDVHLSAGFDRTYDMYTQGAAAADINKDGYKDLIITTMNNLNERRTNAPNLLYLNNGDGTFKDVTKAWGLEDYQVNSMGASFGDINADGFPDLFIGNYFSNSTAGISIYNEQTITNSFQPAEDFLFINLGGQGFLDARTLYGMDYISFGFQGVFTDYDNDRDLDLYIANDFGFKSTPNLMFRNEFPRRKLNDRALQLALNFGMNAMGITKADYNFDGWMDYFVTNLGISLFTVNQENGNYFSQETFQLGLGITVISDSVYTGPPISWGANFFDYDNDTDMDLFVSNGALNPTIRPNPNFFFEYGEGQFQEISSEMGLNDYRIGRGSAVFDYDNDGDLDLFVVNQEPRDPTQQLLEARCLLYRNDNVKGNWLKIALEGVQADKNGIGSRVEVIIDGKTLIREIDGGSGHLSQNSTIAHFGLGEAASVDSVIVKWVGGKTQTLQNINANQLLRIQENVDSKNENAKNELKVMPGFFTDQVLLEYSLQEESPITINVFDSQGKLIEHLTTISLPVTSGIWQWEINRDLPTGTYIFQLKTKDSIVSKRAVKL